jgi:hypothetical protein
MKTKRMCLLFIAVAVALLGTACQETNEAKRMREICARTPGLCQNGLITATLFPRQLGVVLEVHRFKCSVSGTSLQVTARVRDVGDQDFQAGRDGLSLTASISRANSLLTPPLVLIGEPVQRTLGGPFTLRHGADINGNPYETAAIDFAFDVSSSPGVQEITVQIDPNQIQGFPWLQHLSWPSAEDARIPSATPLDLTNASPCNVSRQ